MTDGTDERRNRAEQLHAAAALAKQRFAALRDAFNVMERAHQRGDYSPRPELQQRLEEFREAASEVHRLATRFRAGSESAPDAGGTE